MSDVFTARYRSRCGLCDREIEEGDEAVYVDDEPCHLECANLRGEIDDDD